MDGVFSKSGDTIGTWGVQCIGGTPCFMPGVSRSIWGYHEYIGEYSVYHGFPYEINGFINEHLRMKHGIPQDIYDIPSLES